MEKRKAGRPPHIPSEKTRLIVELLAAEAAPQLEIARLLEIDVKTLRRRYRAQLDRGAAKVEAKLVMHLHCIAGGSDAVALRAIRFALMCRFDWSQYLPRPSN